MIGIELVQDKASRKSYPPEMRIGHKVILDSAQARRDDPAARRCHHSDAAVEHYRRRADDVARCGLRLHRHGDGKLNGPRRIFITGTDTGVGKTFFTCGLAALLRTARLPRRRHEAGGNRLRHARWRALSGRRMASEGSVRLRRAHREDLPVPFARTAGAEHRRRARRREELTSTTCSRSSTRSRRHTTLRWSKAPAD